MGVSGYFLTFPRQRLWPSAPLRAPRGWDSRVDKGYPPAGLFPTLVASTAPQPPSAVSVGAALRGRAFGTKHPMIQREIFPRLNANHEPTRDLQVHPALHDAIAAVRWHVAIYLIIRFPTGRSSIPT